MADLQKVSFNTHVHLLNFFLYPFYFLEDEKTFLPSISFPCSSRLQLLSEHVCSETLETQCSLFQIPFASGKYQILVVVPTFIIWSFPCSWFIWSIHHTALKKACDWLSGCFQEQRSLFCSWLPAPRQLANFCSLQRDKLDKQIHVFGCGYSSSVQKVDSSRIQVEASRTYSDVDAPFLECFLEFQRGLSCPCQHRPQLDHPHIEGPKCKPGIALLASLWVHFPPKCKICNSSEAWLCQTMPVCSGVHCFPLDLSDLDHKTQSNITVAK